MQDDSHTLDPRMAEVKSGTGNGTTDEDAVDREILEASQGEAHQSTGEDDV